MINERGLTVADVPSYDPAVHAADSDEAVTLEMWCACGTTHRQVDPPRHLLEPIASFRAKHAGPGHGVVSGAVGLEERETRRWASLRAEGRQGEYEKREHPASTDAGWDWTEPEAGA